MTQTAVKAPAREWRDGWLTLLLTTGALASGVGLLTISASYFVKPLQAATGWSRGDIAFGTTLSQFGLAFVLPVIGLVAGRFGIKRVSVISMIIYGLACVSMAIVPAKLWLYYVMLVVIALFSSGTSTVVLAQLAAERFVRWRGTVLGIAISGPAILLTPLAPLMVRLTNDVGWRAGYVLLGALALLIGLPCALFAANRRPAGAPKGGAPHAATEGTDPSVGISFGAAIRTPAYWLLMGAAIASTLPLGGFLHQSSALLSDKGMSVSQVGWLASIYVAAIFIGRTAAGFLLDVIYPPLAVMGVMFGAAIGSLLLLNAQPSPALCSIAVALIGGAMGGEGSIQGFFIARQFGMKAFSAIFGTFGMCTVIGFGVGATIFGRLYDQSHNYQTVLMLASGAFAAAGILFGLVPSKPPEAEARLGGELTPSEAA